MRAAVFPSGGVENARNFVDRAVGVEDVDPAQAPPVEVAFDVRTTGEDGKRVAEIGVAQLLGSEVVDEVVLQHDVKLVGGDRLLLVVDRPHAASEVVDAIAEASAMRTKWQLLIDRCLSSDQTFIPPQNACVFGAPVPARFALLGDSHAASIAEEIGNQLRAQQQSVTALTYAGCRPARGLRETDHRFRRCPEYNDLAFAYVAGHPEIETVILVAHWSAYFDGPAHSNGEGGVISGGANFALPTNEPDSFVASKDRAGRVGSAIWAQVEALIKLGRNVVIVYPVPEIGFAAPDRVLQLAVFHPEANREVVSIPLEGHLQRSYNAREQLDRLPETAKTLRVRPEEAFCDMAGSRRCAVEADGKPLHIDDNHLNSVGSALLSQRIVEGMKRPGWL